jgi:hypothetical protein
MTCGFKSLLYYARLSTLALLKFSVIFPYLHPTLSTTQASINLLCIELGSIFEFQLAIDSTGNGLFTSPPKSLFINFTIFVFECIFNHSSLCDELSPKFPFFKSMFLAFISSHGI